MKVRGAWQEWSKANVKAKKVKDLFMAEVMKDPNHAPEEEVKAWLDSKNIMIHNTASNSPEEAGDIAATFLRLWNENQKLISDNVSYEKKMPAFLIPGDKFTYSLPSESGGASPAELISTSKLSKNTDPQWGPIGMEGYLISVKTSVGTEYTVFISKDQPVYVLRTQLATSSPVPKNDLTLTVDKGGVPWQAVSLSTVSPGQVFKYNVNQLSSMIAATEDGKGNPYPSTSSLWKMPPEGMEGWSFMTADGAVPAHPDDIVWVHA